MNDTQEELNSQNHRLPREDEPHATSLQDDRQQQEEADIQRAIAESEALSNQSTSAGYVKSQPPPSSTSAPAHRSTAATSSVNYPKSLPQSPREERPTSPPPPTRSDVPKKMRGLYDFETTAEEELPFKRGDVINVVECLYAEWWKGELRGRVGIFPVNYVVRFIPSVMQGLMTDHHVHILSIGGDQRSLTTLCEERSRDRSSVIRSICCDRFAFEHDEKLGGQQPRYC